MYRSLFSSSKSRDVNMYCLFQLSSVPAKKPLHSVFGLFHVEASILAIENGI